MKKVKGVYPVILIFMLAMAFGYGWCYLVNKDKIESNNFDVNKDGEADILDLLQLQKYLIEEGENNETKNR